MAVDLSHLHSIEDHLIRERARLAKARGDSEVALRTVWVAQAERELANERKFLGLPLEVLAPAMSDDELLLALAA
ncbi:hypothetical protein [uncultured Sphingomonas sp.]|uniref:hypothetical protein n=1 Tax=uncultured Sphingomonas sp. TaxID=158754 RepID=UPI0025CD77B7|nr:hypothetical protein [uncultured Sphingomonas sp.]